MKKKHNKELFQSFIDEIILILIQTLHFKSQLDSRLEATLTYKEVDQHIKNRDSHMFNSFDPNKLSQQGFGLLQSDN